MDELIQDIRYALRTLGRSRGFVAIAVLCLSLGIGVNTSVFSIVNTFLLRPLPIDREQGVLRILAAQPGQGIAEAGMSVADAMDLKQSSRTLEDVALMGSGGFNLAGGEEQPARIPGAYATGNLFSILGVRPVLGRGFLPEEELRGGPRVVLLSDMLWRRQFGADPGVVGRDVVLNGRPTRVVGVMPPRFRFPETEQLWVPFGLDPNDPRDDRGASVVARMRDGATLEQAQREASATAARLAAAHRDTNAGWTFVVQRWRDAYVADMSVMLVLMMAAVGFVLLIACANVANLLLARAAGRRREIAVRAALGATRRRIIRQLITESVLVAAAAGLLGTLVAFGWTRWIVSRIPEELAYWMTFDIDARVLAFTLVLSLATGVVFGTLPALRASRADLQEDLREGTRGSSEGGGRGRLRSALVGGEVALSAVLLVMAALMIRSFLAAASADVGFDTRPLLAMRTSLVGPRYDSLGTRAEFFLRTAERMKTVPGVREAAFSTVLPGDDGGVGVATVAEGRPREPGKETAAVTIAITPGFFSTLNRPLLSGRTFTDVEAADRTAAVAIVNPELAKALWPGEDPLGRRLRLDDEWFTVVGVAPTLHYEEIGEQTPQSRRQVHLPYARHGWRLNTLLVRTQGDPAAAAPAVRAAIRQLDGTLPVFDVRTMEEYRRYTTWDRRIFGEVFASFGVLALLLAAIGVYGVTAYAVSQRRREIGIRMALGARSLDVLREVSRQGSTAIVAGCIGGLLLAWGASRAMRSVLYGVAPADPVSFVVVPVVLVTAAVLATLIPARRATRVDPMVALRSE